MKNLFSTLLVLISFLKFSTAQLSETEPNDNFAESNDVPYNTNMSGTTCGYPEADYFRIFLPADGLLRIYSSISANDPNPATLNLTIESKSHSIFQSFNLIAGANSIAVSDSSFQGCLAADTFYVIINSSSLISYCYSYTFYYDVVSPTYANDVEPNNSFATAPNLPYDANANGHMNFESEPGVPSDQDYYKINLPEDGVLRLYTNIEAESNPSHEINISLFSKTQSYFGDQYPAVGSYGSPASDTVYWGCLSADSFYLKLFTTNINDCGFSYQIRYDEIPASYADDTEPNNTFDEATFLPYNTNTDGNLNYKNEPGTPLENDYYKLISPSDGTLRLFTSAEAQSTGSNALSVTFYDKSENSFGDHYAPLGTFGAPVADTFYYACLNADTFYLKLSSNNVNDCGYAYQIRYDVVPPVFANDIEPNNSFGEAQLVDPNYNIDGHVYYYGDASNDYIKFFKPDTGFLKVYIQSAVTDSSEAHIYLELFNYAQQFVDESSLDAGMNSQPSLDSMVESALPSDTFYIYVQPSGSCSSYQLQFRSSLITGIDESSQSISFAVSPNPSSSSFNIDLGNQQATQLQVIDVNGRIVEDLKTEGITSRIPSFGEKLLPGIYLAKITLRNQSQFILKLVKTE